MYPLWDKYRGKNSGLSLSFRDRWRVCNLPKVKIFSTLQLHHLILAFIIHNQIIFVYIHKCIHALLRASECSERSEHIVVVSSRFFYYIYIYSVTKILRKIRATTFTENYGKLRVRGMSAWDERTPLPISFGSAIHYLFDTR